MVASKITIAWAEKSAGWSKVYQAADVNGDGLNGLLTGLSVLNSSNWKQSAEKTDLALSCRFWWNGSSRPTYLHYWEKVSSILKKRWFDQANSPPQAKHSSSYLTTAKSSKTRWSFLSWFFGKSWQRGLRLFRSGTYISTDDAPFFFRLFLPILCPAKPYPRLAWDESNIASLFIAGNS